MPVELKPASDNAVLVSFGSTITMQHHREVWALTRRLLTTRPRFIRNVHPAYNSVLVICDPLHGTLQEVAEYVQTLITTLANEPLPEPRRVEIPVCYDGPCAPDVQAVAEHCRLTTEEVIALHTRAHYHVYFLGFTPGFAYLGGLPPQLHTPRLASPRTRVPAGSVAIGGAQTGVYPMSTPGGWRIIGKTPLQMFDVKRAEPALLALGDEVRFVQISHEEFEHFVA